MPQSSFILTEESASGSDTLVIVFLNLYYYQPDKRNAYVAKAGFAEAHRIFIYDSSINMLQLGLSPGYPGVASVLGYIREQIARLKPKRIVTSGSSAGGHASLLFGHLLKADVSVAFAPYTNLRPEAFEARGKASSYIGRHIQRLIDGSPLLVPEYLDLRPLLEYYNGKTKFLVHVGRGCLQDVTRARHLQGLPGVRVYEHRFNYHVIDGYLTECGHLRACHSDSYRLPPAPRIWLDRVRFWVNFRLGRLRRMRQTA
ncbi:hypothetical protein [Cerasicoccus fimbriatus]|uniref:hypothetical protein n=1 Tax=Cerasicoccus fimbriatus TaxID=3014554 RepID=UPI0022B2CF93|nr:hypothetical protein [Cerasicoccus sp. TK19100]